MATIDEEQIQRLFREMVLNRGFEFPIHWTMIGFGGGSASGRIEISVIQGGPAAEATCKIIILSGKPGNLRFPINLVFVDKTGKAAFASFTRPDSPADLSSGAPIKLERQGQDETEKFLLKMQELIGDSLTVKKRLEEGSMTLEEALGRTKALKEAVAGEVKKLGLPEGGPPNRPADGKKIFN